MAGTPTGGRKAAATNKEKYDQNYKSEGGFYQHIGGVGGRISRGGGFAANRELAQRAGTKGGRVSASKRMKSTEGMLSIEE